MQQIKQDIVIACRLLVLLHLDSGPFGNVSIRIPGTTDYWVNPEGVLFDQLHADDLVRMNQEGVVLEGKYKPHPGEFIHREIYRRRGDVGAIVHTHSGNTSAHSLLGREIEPYTQLGASIFGDQGVYQGFTGPVRSSNEGAAIAEALQTHAIVIAKNHGLFAANATIQSAWWDMVIADMAAKVHLTALQLGISQADKLNAADLQKSRVEVREKQCNSMWHAYQRNLGCVI